MKHTTGSIDVITGPMFCGKTDELIRRLRRATIARQKVQVFKPVIDDRYGLEKVTSHAGSEYAARPVLNAGAILHHLEADTTVVGIDEAQFFDQAIVSLSQQLADGGIRVIIAGLDTDFRGEPFGPMPVLMAKADAVDKLHAICMVCGQNACRTQRLVDGKPARYNDPVVIVGAAEMYEARCRAHHEVPTRVGGGLEDALGLHPGGLEVALGWLSPGYQQALMPHSSGFGMNSPPTCEMGRCDRVDASWP